MTKAKGTPVAKTVMIPQIQKERMTITITGLSPLLCNRFDPDKIKRIRDKQQKKDTTVGRPVRTPEIEYKASMYMTEDGRPGFIADGIKAACVGACRFVPDMTMTSARGAFYVLGGVLPIEDSEPHMREDVVVIGRGVADLRYRAEFSPPWSITFDVLFNPTVISADDIARLLEIAGFHVGIGDWRPEKSGNKGMFQVARDENG